MGVPKPVALWGWGIAGLVAVGATAMAADLSNLGFKVVGVSAGIISNDAPEIGNWVQEGRRISEEKSADAPAAPAAPVEPGAPAG